MSMKKLMFALAIASISSATFAQQSNKSQNAIVSESVDVMEVPVDKYKVETNRFFDNWFFSVGGGAQVLFGDQSDLGKFGKRIAPALNVSIGKWFTPGLGLRLQYSGLQSKSFSSEPSAYSKPHMLSEGYYQDKFNYMNLHGDILFNISNMLAGYNPDRIYDAVPFVGFGFAHSYDKPHLNSLAFNFGLINTFHVADAWDLNLELYGMGAENKFDGKNFPGMFIFSFTYLTEGTLSNYFKELIVFCHLFPNRVEVDLSFVVLDNVLCGQALSFLLSRLFLLLRCGGRTFTCYIMRRQLFLIQFSGRKYIFIL